MFKNMFESILTEVGEINKKGSTVGHDTIFKVIGIIFAVVGAIIVLSVLKAPEVLGLLFNWSALQTFNPTLALIMPYLMLLFFLVVIVAVIALVIVKSRR